MKCIILILLVVIFVSMFCFGCQSIPKATKIFQSDSDKKYDVIVICYPGERCKTYYVDNNGIKELY